jgi:hypothetical protein
MNKVDENLGLMEHTTSTRGTKDGTKYFVPEQTILSETNRKGNIK